MNYCPRVVSEARNRDTKHKQGGPAAPYEYIDVQGRSNCQESSSRRPPAACCPSARGVRGTGWRYITGRRVCGVAGLRVIVSRVRRRRDRSRRHRRCRVRRLTEVLVLTRNRTLCEHLQMRVIHLALARARSTKVRRLDGGHVEWGRSSLRACS